MAESRVLEVEVNQDRRVISCAPVVMSLSIGTADDSHQFLDLLALLGLVAGSDRMLNAMTDMVAQDLFFKTPQRRAHRRDLGDDVDAVTVLFDHARQAAHLALDPVQTFNARSLDLFSHVA